MDVVLGQPVGAHVVARMGGGVDRQHEQRYAEALRQQPAVAGVAVVDDQGRRFGQADHVGGLFEAEEGVGRGEDRTDLGQPGKEGNGVERRVAPQHDPVVVSDAQ